MSSEIGKHIDYLSVVNLLRNPDRTVFENARFGYCEYTYELLKGKRKQILKGNNLENKLKAILYLDYLIKFHLLPSIIRKSPEAISKESGIDLIILNDIIQNFADSSYNLDNERINFVKSPAKFHKIVYHIIILVLIINQFSMDYTMLAKSMKLEIKQMHDLMLQIGCTFKNPQETKQPEDVEGTASTNKNNSATKKRNNIPTIVELKAPLNLVSTIQNKYTREKK